MPPATKGYWSRPVSRILCLYGDLSTRPTRRVGEQRHPPPIWPCFRWGLHGRVVTHVAGELLPHHFTLTEQARRFVSVALSVGSPRPSLTEVSLGTLLCEVRTFLPYGPPSGRLQGHYGGCRWMRRRFASSPSEYRYRPQDPHFRH